MFDSRSIAPFARRLRMISFDDAQALLVEFVKPLGTEYLPLEDCRRRVLAEDVHALVASPRRDVSAMDGYALRDADAEVGAHFPRSRKSFAGGELPPEIGSGDAARIFTGQVFQEAPIVW
ncbi:MAG: hypothetical protein IPF48_12495 [Sphingomonadales bacterium]|nr:hypothetical protein [Sphingomonadales bacterium]